MNNFDPKPARDYSHQIIEQLIPERRPVNKAHVVLAVLVILFGAFLLFWAADRDPKTWEMHSPLVWWLSWIPIIGGTIWLFVTIERAARG